MNLTTCANKIARRLRVDPCEILTDSIVSPKKIAAILEARGHYSYLDNVCLAECLNKHYQGVNKLLDKYWSAL